MDANPQRPKDRDGVTSALNEAVEALNRAEKFTSVAAAKAISDPVSTLLTTTRYDRHSPVRLAPSLHLIRTQRLMNWVMSSLGYFALISSKRSTGGRTERKWTILTSPCVMR